MNNNKFIMKEMSLKERIKFILVCLFLISAITGALIFFINTCGSTLIDIFTNADTVYYSWLDVFIVIYFPVMGYFDVLVLLFLFTPLTLRIGKLWGKLLNIICAYIYIAFVLAFPFSLYISFVPLADYHSCGQKGPFSGDYYVKDPKMCEQFEYHPEKDKSDE
ncbi:TPA: DUF1240 domain-containing protein [Citrobacter farmeri]|uniref:DUF1240 domain-containing protein n=1 Tax=Citrobacter farmeri TaxID=67824 RepID=UPI00388E2543|nr:DUF1240 domain-containing protein [Citrobacter farmeri]